MALCDPLQAVKKDTPVGVSFFSFLGMVAFNKTTLG